MARSDWLKGTLTAVRDLMVQRLAKAPLDPEIERDLQMALEMLAVMWEELEGQTELLQRESDRFQEFFDFAPDACLVTDAGCNVREANRAAAELFGAAKGDLLGQPLTRFIAEEDRTLFLAKFVSLVLAPGASSVAWECRLQPRGKPPVTATFIVRAIPLRKSGIAGLCWVLRTA